MPIATTVELGEELQARFERLAADRRQAVGALLREAVAQLVEREDNRSGFQAAALNAWAAYQETGLHATFDEVDGWLGRLETGEESAPPECHG